MDATGSTAGFAAAVKMVQPRGTIVMKSTIAERVLVDFAPLIVNEITLVGSRCGRFDVALKLLKGKELRLTPMISGRVAIQEAAAGFTLAGEPGIVKVLLAPGD